MKKRSSPQLMLIASMTIFGTLGLFVRNIPVSSGELALYRAVLAVALIGNFLLITKQPPLGKGAFAAPPLIVQATIWQFFDNLLHPICISKWGAGLF